MARILIIEDDENIAEIEKDYLEINDYEVEISADAISGIQKASSGKFDLILLDLMLPGMDGFSVCKKLRKDLDIPILIVSAKHEASDQILGLGLGADDFIPKPFDPSLLVARVKSNLAQFERGKGNVKKASDKEELQCGPFILNSKTRRILKNGKDLPLKNKEFELLEFLMKHKDTVYTKEDLYEEIWGMDSEGDTTTVSVHVNRIRQKIEEDPSKPKYLLTVWAVGYRFTVSQ